MATTRRQSLKQQQQALRGKEQTKRNAEENADAMPKKRRAVFGDITNALNNKKGNQTKKVARKVQKKPSFLVAVPSSKEPNAKITKNHTHSSQPTDVSYEVIQLSQGSNLSSSQESSSSQSSKNSSFEENQNEKNSLLSQDVPDLATDLPPEVEDIDKENLSDPFQVGLYAFDIFKYYKAREEMFATEDYMLRQTHLTSSMRAILVDWLVEVQENFELNHETLYLAVKMVDLYLSQKTVSREKLQLLGATALFVASKFDERCPPILDDFLYICDDAYKRPEMLSSEIDLLKTVGFDLGIPLSYRFLRRFAKCCKAPMDVLTLARFILEMSLMDYKYTQVAGSKLAAAALLVALTMKKSGTWDDQLVFYTGFCLEELILLGAQLTATIGAPTNKHLGTIRSKYSHKIFLEVAKLPPLSEGEIQNWTEMLPQDRASEIRDDLQKLPKRSGVSPATSRRS